MYVLRQKNANVNQRMHHRRARAENLRVWDGVNTLDDEKVNASRVKEL